MKQIIFSEIEQRLRHAIVAKTGYNVNGDVYRLLPFFRCREYGDRATYTQHHEHSFIDWSTQVSSSNRLLIYIQNRYSGEMHEFDLRILLPEVFE